MKKILAMSLLTMTLTMCFGLTAFAAGSVNTSAPVVSQEVLNSHQAATTVDKVTVNGTEITFEVVASTPQVYENATQAISNVLAAPVAGQNYQVDASSAVVLVDIVPSTQPDGSVNVTIKHSNIVSGKSYLVMHYKDGAWDNQIVTGGNGSLVASFNNFSPVAFVAIEKAAACEESSYSYVDNFAAKVDAAKSSGTPVVITKQDKINTLPISFMKMLLDANVALEMEYTYDGQDFAITIPAGKAVVDENIPYYGPLFLAAYYGNHAGSAATADSYLVVSGDTLSKIANTNKTTVAKLASLNPEIKDVNRIYPGQRIKLK